MKRNLQWLVALMVLLPLLYSCATYKDTMSSFNTHLKEQDYDKAMQSIEANKLIKKNRNALLYNLEMGKLYRLKNDYNNSNKHLNKADKLMEQNNTKSLADFAMGNLINPMRQTYKAEDYEQYMMHFYKALNYAALGYTESAVVEARRITLATNLNSSKYNFASNKYSKDAFALNLQGMIYEMAGDYNNAFIAYRNAVQLYQNNESQYYGVALPTQLQQDLLRMATNMNFVEEVSFYETNFNTTHTQNTADGGALILFLEDGQAPVKQENNFLLTAINGSVNSFSYVNANGLNENFNFNTTIYGFTNENLSTFKTFKLSIPSISILSKQAQAVAVVVNGTTYTTAVAQNMNSIALNVMKERFLKEMGYALARQLAKKLVEKGAEALAESLVKNNGNNNATDTTDTQKNEFVNKNKERKQQVGNIAGLAVNIFNTLNEKADTRTWQTLPAFVQYVRIPLQAGQNNIVIQTEKGNKILQVNGNSRLQMMSVLLN